MNLQNLRILITRPLAQAEKLKTILDAAGGEVALFPTIEIIPEQDKTRAIHVIQNLADTDMMIFISQNAARHALPMIKKVWQVLPVQLKVAAIGKATSDCLIEQGVPVSFCPENNYNSEELLKLSALQDVKAKRIVIFRGQQGRKLLADTLIERGALLTEVSVYRRVLPQYKHEIPNVNDVDVVVCTSNESLHNLCKIISEQLSEWLQQSQLLVISERMRQTAEELGFAKPIIVAEQASDEAIVKALSTMR